MTDYDLFSYPRSPGFKERTTSRDAAEAVKETAATLRGRCKTEIATLPCTPDECAKRLGVNILSVRPRFSELAADGEIVPTGERHANESGLMAKVWKIAEPERG